MTDIIVGKSNACYRVLAQKTCDSFRLSLILMVATDNAIFKI